MIVIAASRILITDHHLLSIFPTEKLPKVIRELEEDLIQDILITMTPTSREEKHIIWHNSNGRNECD